MIISRRKIAQSAAQRIAGGESKTTVLRQLAAYLIENGRRREAELIARDIEQALIAYGVVVGTVTTARKLSNDARNDIEGFVAQNYDAKNVVLREEIDESVLSGFKLELPDKQLDATAKTRLDKITV